MKNIFALLALGAVVVTVTIASGTANAAPAHPLVLVPTTLGTLPSEHGPVLDPIFRTYDNFIATFENNDYDFGETLFVLEYDWQRPLADVANDLANLVSTIKNNTGAETVDIVGHGQGGLIAWHYYDNGGDESVNQLVLLGTPVAGVPASYLAWEGGIFRIHASGLGQGLGQALLDAQAKSSGASSTFDYIQNNALAFRDLLPIPGDLPYLDHGDHPASPFMDALWANGQALLDSHIIRGDLANDEGTIRDFITSPSSNLPLWQHGEPHTIGRSYGDRVVPQHFAEFFDTQLPLDFNHQHLPTAAQSDIFALLNGSPPLNPSTNSTSISCLLFVSTSPGTDMQISGPSNQRLGKDFDSNGVLNEFPHAFYSGFNASPEYGIVVNPADGTYIIQIEGVSGGTFTINASDVCGDDVQATSTPGTVEPGEILDFELTVEEGSITIELIIPPPPPDPTDEEQCALDGGFWNGETCEEIPTCTEEQTYNEATNECDNNPPPPAGSSIEFLPPITANGHMTSANTSIFKAGSNVPVKFKALNAQGHSVELSSAPAWIVPVRGPELATSVSEAEFSEPPTSGSFYKWGGDHYQYNWKTNKQDGGYWYYLFVVFNDGSLHQTIIGLR